MVELYRSPWRDEFEQALRSVRHHLMIVAPYITKREAEMVRRKLKEQQNEVSIRTLTSLNIKSVLAGALDVAALKVLANVSASSEVITLPRLHAKIYVFDESRAVVGSANLTTSALDSNFEYGVALTDSSLVQQVIADFSEVQKGTLRSTILQKSIVADKDQLRRRQRKHFAMRLLMQAERSPRHLLGNDPHRKPFRKPCSTFCQTVRQQRELSIRKSSSCFPIFAMMTRN